MTQTMTDNDGDVTGDQFAPAYTRRGWRQIDLSDADGPPSNLLSFSVARVSFNIWCYLGIFFLLSFLGDHASAGVFIPVIMADLH